MLCTAVFLSLLAFYINAAFVVALQRLQPPSYGPDALRSMQPIAQAGPVGSQYVLHILSRFLAIHLPKPQEPFRKPRAHHQSGYIPMHFGTYLNTHAPPSPVQGASQRAKCANATTVIVP